MTANTSLTPNEVFEAVWQLKPAMQKRLLAALKQRLYPEPTSSLPAVTAQIREQRFKKGFACPHCGHEEVARYGLQNGRQRYRCPTCTKVFNDLTSTPLRGTHYPEKWVDFIECMARRLSLRKCAAKLGISLSTAFVWRHKVLNALKRLERPEFDGILEVDETYFLFSEKGNKHIEGRKPRKRGGTAEKRGLSKEQVCVVVARDRTKQTHARVACCGNISKAQAKVILDPYVKEVSHLCSDANGTWRAFADAAQVPHVELNLSRKIRVKRRIYHIQNVNAFHSRLKDWIRYFRGVASKFLDNYLAWFLFLDPREMEAMAAKRLELIIEACLPVSPETYRGIKETEFCLPT
jgi:transposase-like protein